MNRRRPILFWPLVVVSVVATIWWSLTVPYAPREIFRAIPIEAESLSVHRNLAGRWDEVCKNPVAQMLFATANVKTSDLRDLNQDPQFRDWLGRLASDEFALAYVPALAAGESGYVFASWIGGRSQRLRIALSLSEIPGVKFVGTRHGWPVWVAVSEMFRGGEVMAFSLVEGMLVGSYSATAHGIDTVLDCIDGHHLSLLDDANPGSIPPHDPADRGWYKLPKESDLLRRAPQLDYAFSTLVSNRIAGTIRVPYRWFEGAPVLAGAPPASLAQIFNDVPLAVVSVDGSLARKWMMSDGPDPLTIAFAEIIRDQMQGPLYATLLGGDYRGSIFGLRLSTIAIAAASTNAAQLGDRIANRVQHLNAVKHWELAPGDIETPDARVIAIGATGDSIYAATRPGDQIALAAGADWVVLSSNAGSVTNLLRDEIIRKNRRPLLAHAATAAAAKTNTAFYVWLNISEAARPLRQAMTGIGLKLNDDQRASSTVWMRYARNTIWALEPLGELQVWARDTAAGSEIEFDTSPAQAR